MKGRAAARRILLLALVFLATTRLIAQPAVANRDSGGGILIGLVRGLSFADAPDVNGAAEDLWRLAQLRGASTDGALLRTPSSMMAPLRTLSLGPPWIRARWAFVPPSVEYVHNATVPFSMNDGSLWAGKGANVAVSGGLRVEVNRFQLVLVPQLDHEANLALPFYDNLQSGLPYPLPPYRNVYSTLWNIFPNGADIPYRFGNRTRYHGDPGQSSASVRTGPVMLGLSTENEWWGPGIQNALILSNNAAGVPRVFVRSSRPLNTAIGSVEFSTFLGKLQESEFYRTGVAANGVPISDAAAFEQLGTPTRLIAAGAVSWRPKWDPNVTLGLARSVFEERIYRGPVALRWFDLFRNVGQPNDRPIADSTAQLGRDQLISLFGRWVLPDDGFELYGEWLRATLPVSLRDFLTDPNHSRGYTLGLQWLSPANRRGGALRLQGEVTNVEQDASFRYRPIGSIYTSRVVPQGYTLRGQPIGAAIGPGSSSQWLASDYVDPRWSLGVFGQRIRWNEDAHALTPYPSFKGWCESDVSLIGGLRARWLGPLGAISSSITTSRRYNVFFQMFAACPYMPAQDPGKVVDLHNSTLTLSFEPLVRQFR